MLNAKSSIKFNYFFELSKNLSLNFLIIKVINKKNNKRFKTSSNVVNINRTRA